MSRIRILPPDIANVIAAGEVVERPASVVINCPIDDRYTPLFRASVFAILHRYGG